MLDVDISIALLQDVSQCMLVLISFITINFTPMITQQNEQKKMLIESMKKLTSHVSGNPLRQAQIFEALSLQDFNKIVANLKDENEYLRRVSALLLCQLFYRNDRTKAGLVSLLGIQPKWGRICLSSIPETICKYPSTLKKCVQLMNGQMLQEEDDKICWLINLQRKALKLQFLEYKKYSTFTFLDPAKNIIGVTIRNPVRKAESKFDKLAETHSKMAVTDNIRKRTTQSSSERVQSNSVQYYKQFINDRQKQRQSLGYDRKPQNLTLQLQNRPNLANPSPQYKNQLPTPTNAAKNLNISLETKPPSNDIKSKIDSFRGTIKPVYQVSPKRSQGNTNLQNLQLSGQGSHFPGQIGGGRMNSSRYVHGGKVETARQTYPGQERRFYVRMQNALKK